MDAADDPSLDASRDPPADAARDDVIGGTASDRLAVILADQPAGRVLTIDLEEFTGPSAVGIVDGVDFLQPSLAGVGEALYVVAGRFGAQPALLELVLEDSIEVREVANLPSLPVSLVALPSGLLAVELGDPTSVVAISAVDGGRTDLGSIFGVQGLVGGTASFDGQNVYVIGVNAAGLVRAFSFPPDRPQESTQLGLDGALPLDVIAGAGEAFVLAMEDADQMVVRRVELGSNRTQAVGALEDLIGVYAGASAYRDGVLYLAGSTPSFDTVVVAVEVRDRRLSEIGRIRLGEPVLDLSFVP